MNNPESYEEYKLRKQLEADDISKEERKITLRFIVAGVLISMPIFAIALFSQSNPTTQSPEDYIYYHLDGEYSGDVYQTTLDGSDEGLQCTKTAKIDQDRVACVEWK